MMDFNNIFVNKSTWETFNQEQMDTYVKDVFDYYRKKGFPYYLSDRPTRFSLFHDFIVCCKEKNIIDYDNRTIKQSMNGLALCWSYFPHSFSVRCNDKMSPMDAFLDDKIFMSVIRKRLKMGDNMSDNGIRKTLKLFTGVQAVSNFRPTAAAGIYKMFASLLGKQSIKVYDPCCGYGGRLLGAIGSGVVSSYTGCEPCKDTHDGLNNMCDDFKREWKSNIYNTGCEDIYPGNDFDVVFTSPPYFDTEKYSDEPSQSYIKFPTREEWMEKFLMNGLVDNAYACLKQGGVLCINIADVQSYKTLVKDFIDKMKKRSHQWHAYKSFRLSLSSLKTNKKNDDAPIYKYEPVFIFIKR